MDYVAGGRVARDVEVGWELPPFDGQGWERYVKQE